MQLENEKFRKQQKSLKFLYLLIYFLKCIIPPYPTHLKEHDKNISN